MRVRRELAGTWHREDFPFPLPGPASRLRMSLTRCIMGVSFTEDQHHRVWHSYLPMETGKPTSGNRRPGCLGSQYI